MIELLFALRGTPGKGGEFATPNMLPSTSSLKILGDQMGDQISTDSQVIYYQGIKERIGGVYIRHTQLA